MDKETLKEEVRKTGYLDNSKIGCYFSIKYKELTKEIFTHTKPIEESYVVNQNLRARVKFLFDYDLQIEKIRRGDKWLTFDRSSDDFIDKGGNYVKRGWEKSKRNGMSDLYGKKETIEILRENEYYKIFLGKSKNRVMLKNDPKLFNSIYHHTQFMDNFNKNNNKFSIRMLTLVLYNGNENSIKCRKCFETFTTFNYTLFDFNKLCYNCFHYNNKLKYPNKDWFIVKYPISWRLEYSNFLHQNAQKLQNNGSGVSKISQSIFWRIYDCLTINEQSECFFKELNQEYYINNITNFYFIDFKCKNKIIEFDGIYWHKNTKEKDKLRDQVYIDKGYELLKICENDLSKNKITDDLINRCLKFIRNEN